jgi:anti-sigma regulatory factor (Ser/Thr protein kinase)
VEVMQVDRHISHAIGEPSQIGQARRAAVQAAERLGLDDVAVGRVALIVTELGTNLIKHARQGRLLIAPVKDDEGREVVELLSIDAGPGIADVEACLADGYSTSGTPGNGLGAVRRLANEFDMFSSCPQGTVIMARVGRTPVGGMTQQQVAVEPVTPFSVGAVALAVEGETVSGDAWALAANGSRLALLVSDGLGHGPLAAAASQAALATFKAAPFEGPSLVMNRVHVALRTTRGAAAALAEVDIEKRTVRYCGVGNIAGRLLSGVEDRSLASQHGTAGVQIRHLRDEHYMWPQHALLIMHSDGLTSRWHLEDAAGLLRRHPAVVAAWLMRDHARGRDDATVVVVKWRGGS